MPLLWTRNALNQGLAEDNKAPLGQQREAVANGLRPSDYFYMLTNTLSAAHLKAA